MATTTPFGYPLLEQLRDYVGAAVPNNNDIIYYDSSLGGWKNAPSTPVTAGVESINGLAGVLTLNSANAGIAVSSAVSTIQLTLGELSYGTLAGKAITITSLATNNVLKYNGTAWVNATIVAGVSSVNGQTGAVLLQTANSTLTYGTSGGSTVTTDINLGHANTWTAVQTFTNSDIRLLGSSTGYTTFTSANASATNYTITFPAATGTVALTSGANVASVSDSGAGTMTVSPTTGAVLVAVNLANANTWTAAQTFTNSDLLLLGSSTGYTTFTSANSSGTNYTATFPANTGTIAELNLAQTWSALQTFGTEASFFGTALSGTIGSSGYVLTYNGSNLVMAAIPASTAIAWSSLTNPTGALSLTMAAADTTTFTCSATSQTAFTWTSSTLTGGQLTAFSLTGSSAFNGQSLVSITSTSTGIVGITSALLQVELTGALSGTQSVTAGEFIAFNSGAGVTNIALFLFAVNGGAGNIALKLGGGSILSTAPQTWALESNTASALNITDGTNPYLVINTQTTTSGVSAITFEGTAPTIASASGVTYSGIMDPAYTFTLTGTTTVTALHGLQHYIGQPTVTDSSVVTVTTASTLYIAGPPANAGSVTITNPYALYIGSGNSYFGGGLNTGSIFTEYNNIATVGNGVPSNYGSTLTTPVALGTGSTAIKSYTPVTAGQFLVVVSVVSAASSITGTLTVTYTDPTVGGTATQSQSIAAISSGAGETYIFLCNATTATAISVAGTASTGSDLHASASIFAL